MVSVGFCMDPVGEKNVKSLPETSICLYPEPVTTLLWLAELTEHFFWLACAPKMCLSRPRQTKAPMHRITLACLYHLVLSVLTPDSFSSQHIAA